MRTVIQRVRSAHVETGGNVVGAIEQGLLLLVGVARGDTPEDARATADKVVDLRLFPGVFGGDAPPRPMDRTVQEVGGGCLVVSQFTLPASLRKGRRPSFDGAEVPDRARVLYQAVAERIAARGVFVATGTFGAHMEIHMVADGPVTFVLDICQGKVRP